MLRRSSTTADRQFGSVAPFSVAHPEPLLGVVFDEPLDRAKSEPALHSTWIEAGNNHGHDETRPPLSASSQFIRVPSGSASVETITRFAADYNGYELVAADPAELGRVVGPLMSDVDASGTVPPWVGVDLARAALFYAYRADRFAGGGGPYEPMRALVDHIRERSGGSVRRLGGETGEALDVASPVADKEAVLRSIGFVQVGEVVEQRMHYRSDTKAVCGLGGGVYVFLKPDGSVWKAGMTRNGYHRVMSYTRVLDGRGMKRPHEQTKLESLRTELHDGATQWVLPTADDPTLLEDLLTVMLNPTESNRKVSPRERLLRGLP